MKWLNGYFVISFANANNGGGDWVLGNAEAGIWGMLTAEGIGEEAKQYGLEFPQFQARHEALQLRGPVTAPTLISESPESVNSSGSRIWFAASYFGGETPDFIELKYADQSHFWCRIEPNGSSPEKNRPRLSRGVLYKYVDTTARKGAYKHPFSVKRASSKASSPGEIQAFLNPLIIRYDPDEDLPQSATSKLKQMCAHFRANELVIDVNPCFSNSARLSEQWNRELQSRWARRDCKSENLPVVPRLVLGAEWDPGFVPFMMLDQLGGRFIIDGFASDRPEACGWEPPERRLPDHAQWLADWCLSRMKLELVDAPQFVFPRPAFSSQVATYTRFTNEDPAVTGLQALAGVDNPAAQWLAKWAMKLTSDMEPKAEESEAGRNWQKEELDFFRRQVERNRNSDGSVSVDPILAVLAGMRLLPRSPVCVYLPDAPQPLKAVPDAYAEWTELRNRMLVSLSETPVRAEAWWLKFIWNGADAQPTPAEKQLWFANDASWWYQFYYSLFREAKDYSPVWVVESNDLVGVGVLGTMVLGGKGLIALVSITEFELN
jgi:hypothetical protein